MHLSFYFFIFNYLKVMYRGLYIFSFFIQYVHGQNIIFTNIFFFFFFSQVNMKYNIGTSDIYISRQVELCFSHVYRVDHICFPDKTYCLQSTVAQAERVTHPLSLLCTTSYRNLIRERLLYMSPYRFVIKERQSESKQLLLFSL